MSNQDDRWLWFIDDAPLQALLKAEGELGAMRMRAASSPGLVRAISAQMEGRTAEAISELRAAIDGGESQPEAFLFLGQIHFEARQYEEAVSVYQQLLRLNEEHATAAFNAGVCQEKLSRWNEAADLFRRAAKLDSDRREAWLGLGLCCLHQRRAEDALTAFDRFLENEPDSEPAQFGRAVALQMLRRFDEAALIYERFRSSGEPSAELLTNLLALAVARKDPTELARVAEELDSIRPGARQAAEALAYSAVVSKNWENAAHHFANIANSDSMPEDWAYTHAYALWRLDRGPEAAQLVDVLLLRKPQHAGALLLRGILLEQDGRVDDALSAYRKAAGASSDSDAANWNLARLAASEGNAEVCLRSAQTILERNRHSPEGWFATGLAALLDSRSTDAVHAFGEATRLRRDWHEAEWNLGLSLLELADPGRAEKSLESAYEGLRGKVTVEPLIQAALECGKPDRALAVLESADEAAPEPALIYNLAVAFHESGKFEIAEGLYRRVLASSAPLADAYVNLGHVLLATGRPEDAENAWKEARSLELANA